MIKTKEELYRELIKLKKQLQTKFANNGRAPTIVSDEQIQEIIRVMPRHKQDFLNIKGLGSTFLEKYASYFLQVLNEYYACHQKTKKLTKEVQDTLKVLENRLVNISKRNRLMYLAKAGSKYAIDLYVSGDENHNRNLADFILSTSNKAINICDLTNPNNSLFNEKKFKEIQGLLREINKGIRETGQNDLYIGYPYVIGMTEGEYFPVRAPLLLFPVTATKDGKKITLRIDPQRDALFNNNLVILAQKFLNINQELPNDVYDDERNESLQLCLYNYFHNAHIEIQGGIGDLEKFREYTETTFPKYKQGEYFFQNNAILGKFSLYSTALQRDFRKITNSTEISTLVDELVDAIDDIDIYSEDIEKPELELNTDEKSINYINDLNFAQENCIRTMEQSDKLVIQGPPGTGKSQTITSMIADAVLKGQNVLMASQKKAALDVIYSRLGYLNKYALILSDVKDKFNFYNQLSNMFAKNENFTFCSDELGSVNQKIDNNISNLKLIADEIYNSEINGIPTYRIYQENLSKSDSYKDLDPSLLYACIDPKLLKVNLNELKEILDKFSNTEFLTSYLQYKRLTLNNKYLLDIVDNLSGFGLADFRNSTILYIDTQKEYNSKNIFGKIFASNHKKIIREYFKKYFTSTSSRKLIAKDPDCLNEGLTHYTEFQKVKHIVKTLSPNEELFGKSILSLSNILEKTCNPKDIYTFIIDCLLEDFETKHRDTFRIMDSFTNIIKHTFSSINRKKDLNKEELLSKLCEVYQKEIHESKRKSEMARIVDSKKKWSVNKYLNKFNFELLRGIKIWLLTPEVVSEILPLENELFDMVIFDEASQIYIEKAIPSIVRARKIVVAGDHKQLRPSSLGVGRLEYSDDDENDDTNAALEEESLLDLARFRYPQVMLNYHYRSKYEELIAFSNYAFYNGHLNVSPNITLNDNKPIEVIKIDNGLWQKRKNVNEAKKVVETLKKALLNRPNDETIGVITFNTQQRDTILDLIDEECLKDNKFSNAYRKEISRVEDGEDIGLFIKNIENVQGDERDIIIFSTAYAKNEDGKIIRNFGWLTQVGGENRLNVAISRAKKKIYLVTSIFPEELPIDNLKNDGAKFLRKYLEYCFALSNGEYKVAKTILSTMANNSHTESITFDFNDFQNDVVNSLTNEGYKIETNIGIGNYKVSLGIKDKFSSKYVIAIDFDNNLYNNSNNTRERDIYRQKYLESRGWKVYRLWSSNWYHNKAFELMKIKELFDSIK